MWIKKCHATYLKEVTHRTYYNNLTPLVFTCTAVKHSKNILLGVQTCQTEKNKKSKLLPQHSFIEMFFGINLHIHQNALGPWDELKLGVYCNFSYIGTTFTYWFLAYRICQISGLRDTRRDSKLPKILAIFSYDRDLFKDDKMWKDSLIFICIHKTSWFLHKCTFILYKKIYSLR